VSTVQDFEGWVDKGLFIEFVSLN